MSRPDLLFLAHRIPYPPNKGDKIRSWNMLRYLARDYRVHLGCFIDDPADEPHRAVLEEICASCRFVRLRPRLRRLLCMQGLFTGAPLTLGYFHDRALAGWVREHLAGNGVRRVFVYSSSMAQYVVGAADTGARRVVDFVDVDSDKWRQYAQSRRGVMRWLYGREGRTLLTFERRVAAEVDVSLFVSDAEAALFRRLAPESASRVAAVSNGVDLEYFDPATNFASPFAEGGKALVFTGAMDYWANVDAVVWFARDVLPAIRAACPDAVFWIVGAHPASQVRALEAQPGVRVTGRVDDVRPYIANADVVVAPLRLARGVQNKVLEAMAMARPVVVTPEALEGLDAESGREVVRAAGAAGFADATLAVLAGEDSEAMGARARARVVADYGWAANLASLKEFLEAEPIQ